MSRTIVTSSTGGVGHFLKMPNDYVVRALVQ